MASLESWSDIMYSACDVVGAEEQPLRNHSRSLALFFIVFVVVGSFFVLNLIIGGC